MQFKIKAMLLQCVAELHKSKQILQWSLRQPTIGTYSYSCQLAMFKPKLRNTDFKVATQLILLTFLFKSINKSRWPRVSCTFTRNTYPRFGIRYMKHYSFVYICSVRDYIVDMNAWTTKDFQADVK